MKNKIKPVYNIYGVELNDKYSIRLPDFNYDKSCTVVDFVQEGVESKLNVILNFDKETAYHKNGDEMDYYEFIKCIQSYLGKNKNNL